VLLGVGLLFWAAGDVVLTIQSLGGATPPSPSIADGFYLTFYPLTYVALMLLLRSSIKRFSLASWLDGAVAGFGAAAVCATFAFKDVLHHAGGSAAGVAGGPGVAGRAVGVAARSPVDVVVLQPASAPDRASAAQAASAAGRDRMCQVCSPAAFWAGSGTVPPRRVPRRDSRHADAGRFPGTGGRVSGAGTSRA